MGHGPEPGPRITARGQLQELLGLRQSVGDVVDPVVRVLAEGESVRERSCVPASTGQVHRFLGERGKILGPGAAEDRLHGERGRELTPDRRCLIGREHTFQRRDALAVHLARCAVEPAVVGQRRFRRQRRLTRVQASVDRVEQRRPIGRVATQELRSAQLDRQRVPPWVVRGQGTDRLLVLAGRLAVGELAHGLLRGADTPPDDTVGIGTGREALDEVGRRGHDVGVGHLLELLRDGAVEHRQLESVVGRHELPTDQIVHELQLAPPRSWSSPPCRARRTVAPIDVAGRSSTSASRRAGNRWPITAAAVRATTSSSPRLVSRSAMAMESSAGRAPPPAAPFASSQSG